MLRSYMRSRDGSKPNVVLLGVDDENITRLLAGQPIQVNLRHFDPNGGPIEELPNVDVVIFHATPEAVARISAAYQQQQEGRASGNQDTED